MTSPAASGDADRDSSGRERDDGRQQAAEVEVLQRVDIADEASEQVAVPPVAELRWREGLELVVDPGACVAEAPQRDIVGGQALEVARDRPGETEEADAHDGRGEREDGGLLRGSRDQVAGGPH